MALLARIKSGLKRTVAKGDRVRKHPAMKGYLIVEKAWIDWWRAA